MLAQKIEANRQTSLLDKYDAFVEKFKPKKTTDDCYTPPAVYDAVLDWLTIDCGLEINRDKIARPFYPGNDYTHPKHYEGKECVIDNPPFSILSKIVYYYEERNIPYFLFAPSLTLFSAASGCAANYVVTSSNIKFENGADIPVSFVSNMLGDDKIILDGWLYERIKVAQKSNAPELPRYDYTPTVITSARLGSIAPYCQLRIHKDEAAFIRGIDANKKGIYGGGFLISEKAAAEKAAAEKAAAREVLVFDLSESEKMLIEKLNQNAERRRNETQHGNV